MLTAVMCSGRNRPRTRTASEAVPSDLRFVVGGDEPEQQPGGSGVVQRYKPKLVDEHGVVAQQGVDEVTDGVVGQSPVESLDQLGGGGMRTDVLLRPLQFPSR